MSKVAIEGNASGTGTLTIAAPNTNTNRTITLPDNTGTIITSGSTTGIDASALSTGTLAAARLPAGSVLQVVQGSTSTRVDVASSTYADTGLSAAITPTSATSKILILVNQQTRADRNNNEASALVRILRNSTAIFTPDQDDSGWTIQVNGGSRVILDATKSLVFLDSPATTSSVTYKTQGRTSKTSNDGSANFQIQSSTSVITLMEIAA